MASKRAFSLSVIDSDAFLDMPLTAQALYFHLVMRADDDGFVDSPKKIQRIVRASEDDLRVLIGKQFLIPFDTGVLVIKHWRVHNVIRKDMYKPTLCGEEKAMLEEDSSGSYRIRTEPVTNPLRICTEDVPNTVQERTVNKSKLNKDKLNKDMGEKRKRFTPPTTEEVRQYCAERNNGIDAERFVNFYESKGWMVGKNKMKDWKAAVRNWERMNKEQAQRIANNKFNQFEHHQYDFDQLENEIVSNA